MNLQERGKLGNASHSAGAQQRAKAVLQALDAGECLKRAAHNVGVSYRSAKRYKASRDA